MLIEFDMRRKNLRFAKVKQGKANGQETIFNNDGSKEVNLLQDDQIVETNKFAFKKKKKSIKK